MSVFTIKGNLVDLFKRTTYPAAVEIRDGIIQRITPVDEELQQYILPGFIDAHVHIESSMLVPTAFARLAVVHGTVATVSDPHEIANVCGVEGIQYMIDNAKQTSFKFFFGAPSCVPATFFETAGAIIDAKDIEILLSHPDIWYLAEMMNYPGVLNKDAEVMAKIAAARKVGKPVDGHAPGVKGRLAEQYAAAGITTDHESFTLEEALDKVKYGMYCIIREGSAAKNFEALIDIIRTNPYGVMFCSDDKHPDELVLHHINNHVKRAIAKGYDVYDVLKAACVNPVIHYNLPVGLLREKEAADFIVVDNLHDFNVLKTFIDGACVAENGHTLLTHLPPEPINNFKARSCTPQSFQIPFNEPSATIRVIEALEGQLITNEYLSAGKIENGMLVSDTDHDILKIAVLNRYDPTAKPTLAFIKNFGLKQGAIASTVAHDCHNIIVVGVDDESMSEAVNALIKVQGGISVAVKDNVSCLPLPVAGLMSTEDGYVVAEQYAAVDAKAKALGTSLHAPFMTLSFMALLVIPSLKLSDKGLFNGNNFSFTPVTVSDKIP